MFSKDQRKVRLLLTSGGTIEGLEATRTRQDYILYCPKLFTSGGNESEPVELTGHVEVERDKVLYKQVLSD